MIACGVFRFGAGEGERFVVAGFPCNRAGIWCPDDRFVIHAISGDLAIGGVDVGEDAGAGSVFEQLDTFGGRIAPAHFIATDEYLLRVRVDQAGVEIDVHINGETNRGFDRNTGDVVEVNDREICGFVRLHI